MSPAARETARRLRRTGIVLAVAAAMLGTLHWTAGQTDPFQGAEKALAARVADYTRLRLADDWVALYAMTVPAQRVAVDLAAFLASYGHGALEVRKLEPVGTSVDSATHCASVRMRLDAELVPARLPPGFRSSLRTADEGGLRQESEFESRWEWQDGTWYLAMDQEIVERAGSMEKSVVPPIGR
ncbi:MAG: hypothetical protein HY812_12140 [Planctomycetes bacterium]|nr:hypothetical protein [Planctomycetota bacterium]